MVNARVLLSALRSLAIVVTAPWLGAGCGPRFVSDFGTIRVVEGERVLGRYVSPVAYQHFIQAHLLLAEGERAAAARELRAALNADPDSPELHTLLARTHLELGDLDGAAASMREALRCDPAAADVLVMAADVHEARGQTDAAFAALRRAVAEEPAHPEAGRRLAELHVKTGDRRAALRVLSKALEHRPEDRGVRTEMVELLDEAGNRAAAAALLERMIADDPADIEARVRLGRLEQAAGRLSRAITVLRAAFDVADDTVEAGEALVAALLEARDLAAARDIADLVEERTSRSDLDGRFRVALLLRQVGQAARAKGVLQGLLDRAPDYHRARLTLAFIAQDDRDPGAALAELARVPAASELFTAATRARALLLLKLGRGEEAVKAVSKAADQHRAAGGRSDELVVIAAEVHERRGDVAAALQLLEGAARQRPDSETLQLALASTLERHGDWRRALDVAKKGLERRPTSVPMLNFVGYSLTQRGFDLPEAERLLRRALALDPRNGQVTDSLGWCFFKLGRLDEAQQVLETAERLAPDEPEILRHLGDLFAFRRDRRRALEMYRRALRASPDEPLKNELEGLVRDLEVERQAAN